MLALFLAPDGSFFRVEFAVVIAVDLIETLTIELVALLLWHRRLLVVIGFAPLYVCLVRRGQTGSGQLTRQPRLALLQIVQTEVAVLVEGDHFVPAGRLRGTL